MERETMIALIALISVTASFPFLIYGAWYIIDSEEVTWDVLTTHLKYILTGLALTTIPILTWMIPRLVGQLTGLVALHAVFGLQAYAMLAFALTGIVRIFRAKREHDLYNEYDEQVLLDEIGGEYMDHWRRRLRIGVFGYVIFWLFAYLIGLTRFVMRYVLG